MQLETTKFLTQNTCFTCPCDVHLHGCCSFSSFQDVQLCFARALPCARNASHPGKEGDETPEWISAETPILPCGTSVLTQLHALTACSVRLTQSLAVRLSCSGVSAS